MKNLILLVFGLLIFIPKSHAGIGPHIGFGAPYITQFGLDFTLGDNITLSGGRNSIGGSIDNVDISLAMTEVSLKWHPFSGSFFIGGGVGSQTLSVEAEEELTGATASVDVDSTVTLAKLGWMRGKADGGFWFGIDFTYVIPSGGSVKVKADGLTAADEEFQDAQEAGEVFAETSYLNITLARLGYLF